MADDPPLQLDDLYRHQQREWRFQVVGLVVLGAVVVASFSGLFGHGPLSWGTDASPSGALTVRAPRFARRGGEARMTIRAGPELATGSSFRVALDKEWTDHMGAHQFRPEPDTVQVEGRRMVLGFERRRPGAGLEVTVDLDPHDLWSVSGDVDVGDQSVTVHHFVYP